MTMSRKRAREVYKDQEFYYWTTASFARWDIGTETEVISYVRLSASLA